MKKAGRVYYIDLKQLIQVIDNQRIKCFCNAFKLPCSFIPAGYLQAQEELIWSYKMNEDIYCN